LSATLICGNSRALEHVADAARNRIGSTARHVFAFDRDAARVASDQAGLSAAQRGLAGAGAADDGEEFALATSSETSLTASTGFAAGPPSKLCRRGAKCDRGWAAVISSDYHTARAHQADGTPNCERLSVELSRRGR